LKKSSFDLAVDKASAASSSVNSPTLDSKSNRYTSSSDKSSILY
jgi:hypothetical protein